MQTGFLQSKTVRDDAQIGEKNQHSNTFLYV